MMHTRPTLQPHQPVSERANVSVADDSAKAENRQNILRLAATLILFAVLAAVLMIGRNETPAAGSLMPEMRGSLSLTDTVATQAAPAIEPHAPLLAAAYPSIPAHPFRTVLVLMHIAGLVAGLGTALFLDLYLVSRLYHRPIESHEPALVRFGSRIVLAGLAVLWLSGLGLIAFYSVYAPEALANPKLWAKLAIVVALTINGVLLHHLVLPQLEASVGQPLLVGRPIADAWLPLAAGVASGVSWAAACLLGVVKEWNYVVPASLLLACYVLALIAGISLAFRLHQRFRFGAAKARRIRFFANA